MSLRFASTAAMPDSVRQAAERALARPPAPAQEKGDRRRKHGNCPCTVDGIRFDSKLEARYYERLKLRVLSGEVVYFLRQVPLYLPGGTRLVVDFLEFHADGSHHYVDTKGHETKEFRIKRREIQHHYPITVELVTR